MSGPIHPCGWLCSFLHVLCFHSHERGRTFLSPPRVMPGPIICEESRCRILSRHSGVGYRFPPFATMHLSGEGYRSTVINVEVRFSRRPSMASTKVVCFLRVLSVGSHGLMHISRNDLGTSGAPEINFGRWCHWSASAGPHALHRGCWVVPGNGRL